MTDKSPEQMTDDEFLEWFWVIRQNKNRYGELYERYKHRAKDLFSEDRAPRFFEDPETGRKVYAVLSRRQPVDVDVDELERCADEGLIDPDVFDEVVKPRTVLKGKLEAAVERGDIPQEVLARIATVNEDGTSFVTFDFAD